MTKVEKQNTKLLIMVLSFSMVVYMHKCSGEFLNIFFTRLPYM
jgi:hypothetical protein